MAQQPIDIINLALHLVGAEPLLSDSDNTPIAAQARTRFDAVSVGLLARHPWRFAMRRQTLPAVLAPVTDGPPNFLFAFEVPSWLLGDYYQISAPRGSGYNCPRYVREGRYIWADLPSITVVGTEAAPVNQWPPLFCDVVAHALAADVAEIAMMRLDLAAEMRSRAFGSANVTGEGGLLAVARQADGRGEMTKTLKINSSLLGTFQRAF